MMKVKLFISATLLAAVCNACSQSAENADDTTADSTAVNTAPPADIKDKKAQTVYNNYLSLKNALVSSRAEAAKDAARQLAGSLHKIDGCENTATIAAKISNSSKIEEQRHHFTALSSDIVALMKHTDVSSGRLYVQYCPMANEGEGGYWLSAEEEIRNPYYGDEMLNCGEVKETIGTL